MFASAIFRAIHGAEKFNKALAPYSGVFQRKTPIAPTKFFLFFLFLFPFPFSLFPFPFSYATFLRKTVSCKLLVTLFSISVMKTVM